MSIHFSIKDARFVLSAPSVSHLPKAGAVEVAFWGRSNVGKSSLLNFISARRQLAHVSRTPGRTRALNVFDAIILKNEKGDKSQKPFRFIDLPGFGYAKMSHVEKEQISDVLEDYIVSDRPIRVLFHLLDCRRDITDEDFHVSQSLRRAAGEYIVVLTKLDQIPVSKRVPLQKSFVLKLGIRHEQCVLTSTTEQIGREELLSVLWDRIL